MINNIQVLRAIAAISVVIVHIVGASKLYGYPLYLLNFLDGVGVFGVDLFFVISGFLMAHTQHNSPKKPVEFLINRIVRVVPLYWALTLLLAAIVYHVPYLFSNLKFSFDFVGLSILFLSQLFLSQPPFLVVGWTLEYEMCFYAIFALSLFANNLKSSLRIITFSILALALVFSNYIFLEFLLGIVVFSMYGKVKSLCRLLITIFFVVLSFLLLSVFSKAVGYERFFIFGIPSSMLLLGALSLNQFKNKFVIALGNSSYSIYLIQVFTIPGFYKLIKLRGISFMTNDLIAVFCLLTTLIFGILLHFLFELRITNFFKKQLRD